jgi:hypothetical protein
VRLSQCANSLTSCFVWSQAMCSMNSHIFVAGQGCWRQLEQPQGLDWLDQSKAGCVARILQVRMQDVLWLLRFLSRPPAIRSPGWRTSWPHPCLLLAARSPWHWLAGAPLLRNWFEQTLETLTSARARGVDNKLASASNPSGCTDSWYR